LRRIVLAYLWNPGCDPNSARTIRPNLLIRMLMVPFAIARRFAAWFDAPAFRR